MAKRSASTLVRCPWAQGDQYIEYHDVEWGVPVHDDRLLFEFLILEGAQAGLSWSTILKKRENYREAFDQFDPAIVAKYSKKKQASLMANAGIVRNRLKIESAINNAKAFGAVQGEFGSFDKFIWGFVDGHPKQNSWKRIKDVPASTPESDAMSKDLKRRGFRFVGRTICYAFMQAVGMVNDHLVGCFRHAELKPRMLWFVYMLRCADDSLYTGITNDLIRRLKQHNAGTASRYTRSRLPVVLVYQEAQASHSLALKRELAIKAFSRQNKESLIRAAGPATPQEAFKDLSHGLKQPECQPMNDARPAGRIVVIPFLQGKLTVDGKLSEPDIYFIMDKWLDRHPEFRGREKEFRISRGEIHLPGGFRTELLRVTAEFSPDLAGYDPAQDADLYKQFLADPDSPQCK